MQQGQAAAAAAVKPKQASRCHELQRGRHMSRRRSSGVQVWRCKCEDASGQGAAPDAAAVATTMWRLHCSSSDDRSLKLQSKRHVSCHPLRLAASHPHCCCSMPARDTAAFVCDAHAAGCGQEQRQRQHDVRAPASLLLIMLLSTAWPAAAASLCRTAASLSPCAFAAASASRGSSSFIFFFNATLCVSDECARAAAASAASEQEAARARCVATSDSREAHVDLRRDSCCSICSMASAAARDALW